MCSLLPISCFCLLSFDSSRIFMREHNCASCHLFLPKFVNLYFGRQKRKTVREVAKGQVDESKKQEAKSTL